MSDRAKKASATKLKKMQLEDAKAEIDIANKMWTWRWSEEQLRLVLEKIHDYIHKTPKCVYMQEALVKFGLYEHWYDNMKRKYIEHSEFQWKFKYLQAVLEARLVNGSMKGDLKERISMFVLINNYGWKQQVTHDITSAGERLEGAQTNVVNISSYTPDQLLQLESIMLEANNTREIT
jgi:hypothetical protein